MIKFRLFTRLLFMIFLMLGQSVAIAAAQMHTATGKVIAVDNAAGKITIHHERIESLDWPAMTMTFAVEDPSLLKPVIRPGDNVYFTLAESNGEYVIQQLQHGAD